MFSHKSLFSFVKIWLVLPPIPPSNPPLGGQKVSPPQEPFLGAQKFLRHSLLPPEKKSAPMCVVVVIGLSTVVVQGHEARVQRRCFPSSWVFLMGSLNAFVVDNV